MPNIIKSLKYSCKLILSLILIGNMAYASLPIYIGTYTKNATPSGNGEGIYYITLDTSTNQLDSSLKLAATCDNPSYLLVGDKNLYAVNEVDNFSKQKSGSVSAYDIKDNGELEFINSQSSIGKFPVHLTFDKAANNHYENLIVANYNANDQKNAAGITVLPLAKDGSIKSATQMIAYTGSGLDQQRQLSPHTHAVNVIDVKDKHFVLATDLGIDTIYSYILNSKTGTLTQSAETAITDPDNPKTATGPRHIAVSPDKKYVYVSNELVSYIYVYKFNGNNGSLKFIQKVKSYAGELSVERNYPSEIATSVDGKFLYVSNRGQNTIAEFKINKNKGTISYLNEVSTFGDFPRDFDIDSSGKYLVVANQKSDSITLFTINQHTGVLGYLMKVSVPTPITVKFGKG